MSEPLVVDVWSDIACPWCFIGKRRLEAAIAQEPPGAVVVRWHAFQLAPDLPAGGVDALAHYTKKFGPAFPRMHARVAAMAAEDGLSFAATPKWAANTRLGHRLIAIARDLDVGDAVVELLFRAQHEDGVHVGDLDAVLAHFARNGIPARQIEALRAGVAAGAGEESVDEDLRTAAEIGIEGVPFFVAGGRVAMSGAQPTDAFRALFAKARALVEAPAASP